MDKDNNFDLSKPSKKKRKEKKNGTMDKVIFGLLIGGAIGSVLGLTVAPKKGDKTREDIKKAKGKISSKGKEIFDEHEDAIAMVSNKSKGIVSFFTDKILGKDKEEEREPGILDWISDMANIPSEAEEVEEEISQ